MSSVRAASSTGNVQSGDPGPRPVAPTPQADAIPAELKALPQWVSWKYELDKKGRWTKVPYRARNTHRKASTTDPKTWGSYDQAMAAFWEHRFSEGRERVDGIGFVFSADDPYTGFDLDHCLDENGQPLPWALPYLSKLTTYGEISPSGRGVKGIARAALPGQGNKATGLGPNGAAAELYDHDRYFTVTGKVLPGHPTTIEPLQGVLDTLHATLFPPKPKAKPKPSPNGQASTSLPGDDELIALARRYNPAFSPLFDQGDVTANNGDWSAADFALCSLLAYWFRRDEAAIDRVFRRSALMREKWDERRGETTYGAFTIGNAVAAADKVYEPRPKPKFEDGVPGAQPSGNGDGKGPAAAVTRHEDPINRTDLGNARRLVRRFGRNIRFCPKWGVWLIWDGKRWREDETGEIYRLAKQTVRGIGAEAAAAVDDEGAKALLRWALISEAKARVDALVSMAWSEPGIPVETGELNRNPWLLNVANGTVDLKTGELLPHRQEDLITKLAPVAYDPEAECPRFFAFLDRIMQGNRSLIGFIQRAFGYALTGDVGEHCLFFLYGTGRNGKGTLLETFLALLGDYATTVDAGLITVKRNEDHPTGLTDLDGRRFVPTVEVEDGKRLAEALVKKLTGGDRIKARRMRENNYEFDPSHKLFLAANHPPEIRGTDEGIWSRIKLIPFSVFIPPAERVRTLRETLVREEGPGILAWAVRGCLEWQEGGLNEPTEVVAATGGYRASMDTIGTFIDECCMVAAGLKAKATPLYTRFKAWAEKSGETVINQRKFGRAMTERGFKRETNNGIWYQGIGLRTDEADSF